MTTQTTTPIKPDWPATTEPAVHGLLRCKAEDFQVTEIPLVLPSGEGEHIWLQLRKRQTNTDWLAGQLAKIAGVARKAVSYAGLKDRHALTTQWFSVHLPGKADIDWQTQLPEEVELLACARHQKKLKRGALKGNRFQITVRDCKGERERLEKRVSVVAQHGVPNYFGEQRFGHEFNNITQVRAWFEGQLRPRSRLQKSLYLSSARSWLFNEILAQRVHQKIWNQAQEGDTFILAGSHSWFCEAIDDAIIRRVAEQDIHPAGVLYGAEDRRRQHKTTSAVSSDAGDSTLKITYDVLLHNDVLCQGLIKHGLKQEWRALRLSVEELSYHWNGAHLVLSFNLAAGAYATTVLRELISYTLCQVDAA